jgi:hypothetical protein
MSYASVPPPEPTTLADLASPEAVSARATSVRTVVLSLLAAAVVVAGVVVGIGWFVGAISHTEAGFCGRASTPCTSLSAESVAKYAAVELPPGVDVTDAYYLDWATSMVRTEVPEAAGFSAAVRLPAGAKAVSLGTEYGAAMDESEIPADVLARWDDQLDDIVYSSRIDDNNPTDPVVRTALRGTDSDGRLVYEFTATPALR